MTANNYKPVKTSFTRSFVIEGRARGDHRPAYSSQMKLSGLTQSFGDVTDIEIPDPSAYDKFLKVDRTQGMVGRATLTLTQRYAAAIKSILLRLSKARCALDVQLHMGECTDPSAFNVFSKALIMEDVVMTNWAPDDLGALSGDETNPVNEKSDMSAAEVYEVVPLSFAERAQDVVTNQLLDGTICDSLSCGTCGTESDGCKKIFATSTAAGGSPTTPADVVFSLDKGATWFAHDVDTMVTAEVPGGIACMGSYLVVFSYTTPALHYALKSEFDFSGDPAFTKVTTGFVAGKGPNSAFAYNGKAFIVGDGGYVYWTEDPTSGVTVLDAGLATASKLNRVFAFDEDHAVAVGNDGAIVYTTNRTSWSRAAGTPVAFGTHLLGVAMKSWTEWWITANNGTMYYTLDSGQHWTQKIVPGTTPSSLKSIRFATKSVGFLAGTVSSHGRIYRTFDGGYSWVVLPESIGTMPVSDTFNAVIVCTNDPDFVVAVGLADNGTDGMVVVGTPQS